MLWIHTKSSRTDLHLVAMGYGMHRAMASRGTNSGYEEKFNERNAEQDDYMVNLRMSHRAALEREMGRGPRHHGHALPY